MVSLIIRALASKALIVIVACLLANQAGRLTKARELVGPHNIGRNPSHGNDSDTDSISSFRHSSSRPNKIRITLKRNVTYEKGYLPQFNYYGVAEVGSSRRKMAFDTASNEIWIAKKGTVIPTYLDLNNVYDYPGADKDYHQTSFTYEDMTIVGNISDDTFTLFQDSPLDQMSFVQNFFVIQTENYPQLQCKHYDGVIGLAPVDRSGHGIRNILHSIHDHEIGGFPEPNRPYKLRKQQQNEQYEHERGKPFGNVDSKNERGNERIKNDEYGELFGDDYNVEEGLGISEDEDEFDSRFNSRRKKGPENYYSKLMFAFWFDPKESGKIGGELTIGGINRHRFVGDIQYYNINSEDAWRLPISRVRLGEKVVSCKEGCDAFLATGIDTVTGPDEDVIKIYDKLGAKFRKDLDLYTVDCNRVREFEPVKINFNEKMYVHLSERHYIREFRYGFNQVCYVNIKGGSGPNWFLGTPFISAFYTVFDLENRRVGFATPHKDHSEI